MAKHGGIDVSNDLPDDTALALQAELRTDTQSEPAVTLQDICSTCAITTEYVYELVELGVLEPVQGDDPGSCPREGVTAVDEADFLGAERSSDSDGAGDVCPAAKDRYVCGSPVCGYCTGR